jgi:hypothetical protein
MASYANDRASDHSDPKHAASPYSLDEKRRAALAEVDNAKFSYALQ